MLLRVAILTFFAHVLNEPSVLALKMPSYLKACHRDDPNLGECAKRSGTAGIAHFVNGDRKYKIPNLNPMEIIELNVRQGTESVGLNIKMTNLKAYGLPDTIIEDINLDYYNRTWTWHLLVPRLEALTKYSVTGKILLLPITGSGDANITITNARFSYTNSWDLVTRNGIEYTSPKKGSITYTTDRAYIKLENLFNGDKLLGPQMNKFLNENWEEANKEIGPAISSAVSQVIDSVLNSIALLVPNDDIFPKGSS